MFVYCCYCYDWSYIMTRVLFQTIEFILPMHNNPCVTVYALHLQATIFSGQFKFVFELLGAAHFLQ